MYYKFKNYNASKRHILLLYDITKTKKRKHKFETYLGAKNKTKGIMKASYMFAIIQ